MKHKQATSLLVDFVDGNLTASVAEEVSQHLESCDECKQEVAELKQLLESFENEPQRTPPASLEANFLDMVQKEKQEVDKVVSLPSEPLAERSLWTKNVMKIAAGIALLVGAYSLGKFQTSTASDQVIAALEAEQITMKETTMLSLMESKSASKRIQGVNYMDDFTDPDEAIVSALVRRMLNDENTNVRLTAVNALRRFIASETVKNGFIKALETERDPTIQVALIEALVEVQERKALKPMQQLLDHEETQPFVKDQIKSSIPNMT